MAPPGRRVTRSAASAAADDNRGAVRASKRPRTASGDGAQPEADAYVLPGVSGVPALFERSLGAKEAEHAEEPEDGLTEYERQREEQIRRNRERMEALCLPGLAGAVAPAAPATAPRRGLGAAAARAKAKKEPAAPARRSLRAAGVQPDGSLAAGIQEERRDGTVVLVAGEVIRYRNDAVEVAKPAEKPGRPEGVLAFESTNATAGADAAFVRSLRAGASASEPRGATVSPRPLSRLRLSGDEVAKVTEKGTSHLDVMPSVEGGPLVVAAGDKGGNVGLWYVDWDPEAAWEKGEGDDDGGELDAARKLDGVLCTRPHGAYVSGLKWLRSGPARLASLSYDGSARALDVASGTSLELYAPPGGEDEFSAFDFTADGSLAFVGDNAGGLRVVDLRAGDATTSPFVVHEKKVNTVHLEPGEEMLLATSNSTGGEACVCVWDRRKLGAQRGAGPLAKLPHVKSCQAAYFAPDGSRRLLTSCYDDRLRVWSGFDGAARASVAVKHNMNTGRWTMPFRAVWGAASDTFVVGCMSRSTCVYSASTGKPVAKCQSEFLTAAPSRHTVSAEHGVVVGATSSGKLHVWRQPE